MNVSGEMDKQLKVICVEDDVLEQVKLKESFNSSPHKDLLSLRIFSDPAKFSKNIAKLEFDIAIFDVYFDEHAITGIDLAKLARVSRPDSVILLRTISSDAVHEFASSGADEFLYKNEQGQDGDLCQRILQVYRGCHPLTGDDNSAPGVQPVGQSMLQVSSRIRSIMNSSVRSLHVHGETGTGKEVVAEMMAAGVAAGKPFIKINCAALSPTLLESELFGHKKGAFTGALSDRRGVLEAAHGGWIFLDEIPELPKHAQASLLRVIENGELRRVGETEVRKIDVRVISATNENLKELVEGGSFRRDLWQRLCETEIALQPLRRRKSEIEALAVHFAESAEGGPYYIEHAAMEILKACQWRAGNVRALRNCIRAMTEKSIDKKLGVGAIPLRVWQDHHRAQNNVVELVDSDNEQSTSGISLSWEGQTPNFKQPDGETFL